MANLSAQKQYANNFNKGVEYVDGNSLPADTINRLIKGLLYAQENADTVSKLPSVSSSDNGKFLRVNSSGQWVATTVDSAEGKTF